MGRAREDGPLVASARAGSEDAWRELYLLHHRRLVIWLVTVGSPDAAIAPEDVASEAWMVAAGKIGEFRGSDHELGGWLVAISRNIVANHVRRAARRRTDPVEEFPTLVVPGPSLADRVVSEVAAEAWVRRALATLSRREAEVVACMDVVGLDVAATARALGMTAGAVRVARHRALGRLRKVVSHDGTDGGVVSKIN